MSLLSVAEFKQKYGDTVLLKRLTDDEDTGSIIDAKIEVAIEEAEVELGNYIELDTAVYGLTRLKVWERELAYYYLFSRVEREKVAMDKYKSVMKSIETFKRYRKEEIEAENSSDYPDGYVTVGEEILEEDDILDWW